MFIKANTTTEMANNDFLLVSKKPVNKTHTLKNKHLESLFFNCLFCVRKIYCFFKKTLYITGRQLEIVDMPKSDGHEKARTKLALHSGLVFFNDWIAARVVFMCFFRTSICLQDNSRRSFYTFQDDS